MRTEQLARLQEYGVSYDTETHLTQPGLALPPLVCAAVATVKSGGALLDKDQARETYLKIISDPRLILIGQRIAYDNGVMAVDFARRGIDIMPLIVKMYLDQRVYDIGIAEQLHAIANGHLLSDPRTGGKLRDPGTGEGGVGYRLSVLQDLVLGRTDAKVNDRFRKSYQLLEHLPINEWPLEARTYPVDDVVNPLEIAIAQVARNRNLHEVSDQAFSDFCLTLGGAQGFMSDPEAIEALSVKTQQARDEHVQEFIDADFFKRRSYKKRCQLCKGPVEKQGLECPECHGGAIQVSAKTGAESRNMRRIKNLIADAYGVSGVCPFCEGQGEVPGSMAHKGCVPGCVTPGCVEGKVPNPKTTKGCPKCDTTGRDLNTAPIPTTPSGGVSTGRDPLNESGDELLMNFARFCEADKIGTTYLPWLRKGVTEDGRRIPLTLRPNVLLATGRISYSGVVQLLPRKGGVRECVVFPEGWTGISADYKGLELVTHAQSCINILGESVLAQVLNAGKDAHSLLGADMCGMVYDDFVAKRKGGDKRVGDYRQAAKPGNFGFPGGMGAPKMVLQQRSADFKTFAEDGTEYNGLRFCLLVGGAKRCGVEKVTKWGRATMPPTCKRCIECADVLRNSWFNTYTENRPYFKHINQLMDAGEMVQHASNRIRGGIDFCSAANSYFQALGADVTKLALRRVVAEQFADKSSDLYGSRFILMAHDELFIQARDEQADAAARRLSAVMVGALQELCPDLAAAAEAEPALMKRWYKGAEAVYDEKGALVPWSP